MEEEALTESEWLASTDPAAMLEHLLYGRKCDNSLYGPSDRKLFLFVCAVERVWWGNKAGPLEKSSLKILEHIADGKLDIEHLARVVFSYSLSGDAAACAREGVRIHSSKGDPPLWANLLRDIFGNPFRLLPRLARQVWECKVCGARPDAEGDVEHGNGCYMLSEDGGGSEWVEEVSPLSRWLTWNAGTVSKLAQAIYDQRQFGDMPILADALEDAGCREEAILQHCRGWEKCGQCLGGWIPRTGGWMGADVCRACTGPSEAPSGWRPVGPHCRGCWVIDAILGLN